MGEEVRDGAVDGVLGSVYFCVSGGSGVVGEVMGLGGGCGAGREKGKGGGEGESAWS